MPNKERERAKKREREKSKEGEGEFWRVIETFFQNDVDFSERKRISRGAGLDILCVVYVIIHLSFE
jgi:hypothetical protein